MRKDPILTIGWREWVAFPELGVDRIKAKIDTGARTSALHAFGIEEYTRRGVRWVKFKIHPFQKDNRHEIEARAPLVEHRHVKSSHGHRTLRPVIRTPVLIGGILWEIELTLVNRDEMGFRLLLGREAIRGRYLVNPGRSYLQGPRPKGSKKSGRRQ